MAPLPASFRLLIVLGACLALACGEVPLLVTVTPDPTAVACPQDALDTIRALHDGLEVPKYLQEADAAKQGGEFDANSYFTVLKHLSLEPGYVLDWVYRWELMGGNPVLYARKSDMAPYRTLSEYLDAVGDQDQFEYLNHVQADGTPAGFVEFVVLRMMANQFYLVWHAGYDDGRIVCSRSVLEQIVQAHTGDDFGLPMSAEQQQAARALDVRPRVELGDGTARVKVVIFTKWGGFIQLTTTLEREFPHHFVNQDATTLVDYDCGIRF